MDRTKIREIRERMALIDFGLAYTKVGMTGNVMPFSIIPTTIPFIAQYREVRMPKPNSMMSIIKAQTMPISAQVDEFLHFIIF